MENNNRSCKLHTTFKIDALTFTSPMSIAFLTTVMMRIVTKILLGYIRQSSAVFRLTPK